MKLICEITNKEVGEVSEVSNKPCLDRHAARAILIDEDKKVAIIEAKNIKIHKILGGGIEEGEDIELALEREIMEESGCKGEVFEEVGTIIEHRTNRNFKQTNYCYLAKLVGEKGTPTFTDKEIEEGFKLVWIDLDDAIKRFEMDDPDQYSAKFQGYRDRIFLQTAKEILEKQ